MYASYSFAATRHDGELVQAFRLFWSSAWFVQGRPVPLSLWTLRGQMYRSKTSRAVSRYFAFPDTSVIRMSVRQIQAMSSV